MQGEVSVHVLVQAAGGVTHGTKGAHTRRRSASPLSFCSPASHQQEPRALWHQQHVGNGADPGRQRGQHQEYSPTGPRDHRPSQACRIDGAHHPVSCQADHELPPEYHRIENNDLFIVTGRTNHTGTTDVCPFQWWSRGARAQNYTDRTAGEAGRCPWAPTATRRGSSENGSSIS